MKNLNRNIAVVLFAIAAFAIVVSFSSCSDKEKTGPSLSGDEAEKVYVAPGKYDEFYYFISGGFSGQLSTYGIPSGRLFRVIPVFSVDPEKGYGYTEETKPMLNTSYGFIPWDDAHHTELSQTDGVPDGRWAFINGNNTPRIARIDLTTFRTVEIIEIPNSAGNHSSPFTTPNTDYVVAGTRFSVPVENRDVPIDSYKENFRGAISFIKVDKEKGSMNLAFQIITPPFDYDLSHSGKGPSDGWYFFSCYNSEEANTLLEVEASQKDKDFIMAVNWKKVEELVAGGKGTMMNTRYAHNVWNESKQLATSEIMTTVKTLKPDELEGCIFYIPCPKSPHGADVDPTGEYIVGGGKLATVIPVFSYTKMKAAIDGKQFDGDVEGIPVLKYDAVLAGEVKNPGLGPLHTEFDNNGFAYTSAFISSEIVKWNVAKQEVVDRIPVYYSVGHLSIPGGDSKKPWGKYLISLNKMTKDRYLPTGPELTQSAQLIDISGDKMKLLLDFPTIGEPHYAQGIPADLVSPNSVKIYKIEENENPYAIKSINDSRVEREGNVVHMYIAATRSHFTPDNVEGIKMGDTVYVHVTNLEQDWDIPHGFAIMGNQTSEMLIMPGETCTIKWLPYKTGIFPMYCTDFCSALHQEMQGYIRVSAKDSDVPVKYSLGTETK
ncbi:MAG TPA: Sec-dependent nitrous-oxide reductase [Ignavibacteria bacterium]|nr:Sec-dependent nitrous-oxide reductase [Ignavibacteria bacterium]HMR41166.1 Sec-dependent nitrous-oxide reductase [Ignavibacteria bacterium]